MRQDVFSADEVELTVKDNGIGIAEGEIPYIFDRGYIGSNLRNGDYRSTGMGLYFVKGDSRTSRDPAAGIFQTGGGHPVYASFFK